MGAALASAVERLPNGVGFQFVFANFVSSSGEELEGKGVLPDSEVHLDREALLQGNDNVIEAAIGLIDREGGRSEEVMK